MGGYMAGRPRKLRDDSAVAVQDPPVKSVERKVPKTIQEYGIDDLLPYDGNTSSLKSAKVTIKQGRKDAPPSRRIVAGEPRFFLKRNGKNVLLMAIYKNGKGVGRRSLRLMKVEKKKADKAIYKQIKEKGIPEY